MPGRRNYPGSQQIKVQTDHHPPVLKILVVDDEAALRTFAAVLLEDLGYSALLAESGRAAVQCLLQEPDAVRAVLLDMTMPGMTPEETFRLLREIRPDLPVIILSGDLEATVRKRFAPGAITGYIQKPYSDLELAPVLERAIALPAAPFKLERLSEDELATMGRDYLSKCRLDLAGMAASLDSHDFVSLQIAAHSLKGSAGCFGFSELTQIGKALEDYATASDAPSCGVQIDELRRYLCRSEVDHLGLRRYCASRNQTDTNPLKTEVTNQAEAGNFLVLQAHLLDNTYEPTLAWELDGSVVYWNRAAEELYGFPSSVAVGTSIHELLQTAHPVPLDEILRRLESQFLWSGELTYETSGGVTLTIESHLKLICLPGRKPVVLQSDRDIGIYKQTESAMREVYEDLENRVQERTQQLAVANKELESFSYSVSHDLRSPLRSLMGFARILTRDYAGKLLDEHALDLIQRMTASVSRMGQLIEDLLRLSQLSRAAMQLQPLDLSAMANSVLDDLRHRDPQREVSIQVEAGLTAMADAGLLRLVLENLLGNAWKFTGKTAGANISVGMLRGMRTASTYFIQDNGAGFDMDFADQLFAPFQRLHRATEFEGTGVGLATVQRVVHRHAGRIWAESSPGQGAKFLFTLGTEMGSKGK